MRGRGAAARVAPSRQPEGTTMSRDEEARAATGPDPEPRSVRFAWLLFGITTVAAAVLRVMYLLPLRGLPLFDEPHRDSLFYVARARSSKVWPVALSIASRRVKACHRRIATSTYLGSSSIA